ncbi:MAG: helix-turn-helix domain-containing protein, partial [Candidatus Dormibacteria bacterium]
LPQRLFRWSDQEVADARASLRRRGWLGPEPSPTESGRQASADIEAETELWSATLLGDLGEAGLAAVAAAAAEFWPGSDS